MSQETPVELPRPQAWPSLVTWITAFVLLILLVALLLPSVNHGRREPENRSHCVNCLKQIGIALMTYHDTFKTYPPALINDEHGIPMHSWRALLLPYFDIEECQKLGKQYRLDEPWNGPNNRLLLDKAPEVYRCVADDDNRNEANYLAIVGSETMWRGIKPMRIREVSDGIHKTIAIVECSDSGINWLEPRDVTFPDAEAGINKVTGRASIRSHHAGGAMILMSDGSVHFLSNDIKSDILRGLLTPAGGEDVDIPE